MKKIANASEAVVPVSLTTQGVKIIKPDAYILASKVKGEEWQAMCLGHMDEPAAMRVADIKKGCLSSFGKPFEVRLERLVIVLHETSAYIN